MRGQKVTAQYVAGRDMNFGTVQNRGDLVAELEKLKVAFPQAANEGIIDAEVATDAEYQVTKAIQQAEKSEPDKGRILGHLDEAKALIAGVTVASGMVTALTQAAEMVHKLF